MTSVNSGVGAHSSEYGALRLQSDVLNYSPGVVVIDFAANDNGAVDVAAIAEANIRRIRIGLPGAKLIFIAFGSVTDPLVNDPTNVNQSARDVWDAICVHYGIPVVDWWQAMTTAVDAETNVVSDFFADNVHPNPHGHSLATSLLVPELPQSIINAPAQWSGDIGDYARIYPASADYEHDSFEIAGDGGIEAGTGWTDYGASGRQSSTTNDTISFSGEFIMWGLDVNYGVGAGTMAYSVDGEEFTNYDLSSRTFPIRVFNNINVRGNHTIIIKVVSGLVQITEFMAI